MVNTDSDEEDSPGLDRRGKSPKPMNNRRHLKHRNSILPGTEQPAKSPDSDGMPQIGAMDVVAAWSGLFKEDDETSSEEEEEEEDEEEEEEEGGEEESDRDKDSPEKPGRRSIPKKSNAGRPRTTMLGRGTAGALLKVGPGFTAHHLTNP